MEYVYYDTENIVKHHRKQIMICIFLLFCSGCRQSASEQGNLKDFSLIEEEKDLTPPIIICDSDSYEIELGANFDLKEHIEVVDNKTKNIRYQIEGDFDKYKPGHYQVEIVAKDHAGNEARKALEILVRDTSSKKEPSKAIPPNKESDTTPLPNTNLQPNGVTPIINTPTENGNSIAVETVVSQTKPEERSFLFTEGYTTSTGLKPADHACQQYLLSVHTSGYSGHCEILYDQDRNPIGTKATFH